MAIVVELLDRNGQRKKLIRTDKQTVTIGRAYNNDIQLDDPYVDPRHVVAELNDEGAVILTDCDSLNGMQVNDQHYQQSVVNSADMIKLGRSQLRIFSQDREVAPTLKLNPMESRIEWMNSMFVSIGLAAVYAALSLYSDYMSQFEEIRWGSLFGQTGAQMAVLCIWPLFFGLLSKLNGKEARLTSQFSLLWLTLSVTFVISLIEIFVRYNTAISDAMDTIMLIVVAMLLWSFYWVSLFVAFHQPQKRRHVIASVMVFVSLVPLSYFTFHNSDDFSQRAAYDSTLLPPALLLRSPQPTSTFMDNVDQLFDDVDALRSAGADN